VLATAIAARNATVLTALDADARDHLSDVAGTAARSAAAIMAMNNVYYRSKHQLADAGVAGYDDIPARLRMQVIGTSGGVDKADFEYWCFAVSAVNGCGQCLASHEHVLREAGVSKEQIHEALRIAATVHAVAVTHETEASLVSG
jgi:alkyl hydroperoxide reductase subunit D